VFREEAQFSICKAVERHWNTTACACIPLAPLKLRPYGAIQICLLLLFIMIIILVPSNLCDNGNVHAELWCRLLPCHVIVAIAVSNIAVKVIALRCMCVTGHSRVLGLRHPTCLQRGRHATNTQNI